MDVNSLFLYLVKKLVVELQEGLNLCKGSKNDLCSIQILLKMPERYISACLLSFV
jgi:hypothetical protein